MAGNKSDRVAVVTVHGTNDASEDGQSPKWWQATSPFADRLKRGLRQHGVTAEVVPFVWSGANSALAREKAAYALAIALKRHAREFHEVHVVAHSHGGNVANDAARILRRRAKDAPYKIASMTTVGTPFFKSALSTANTYGWWALLIVFGASVLAFVALLLAALGPTPPVKPPGWDFLRNQYAMMQTWRIGDAPWGRWAVSPAVLITANLVALVLIIPAALEGARRMLRVRARRHGAQSFLSLWHPNDEAIAFLSKFDRLSLEPLPPGSMIRSSRITALVLGARTVMATLFGGAVVLAIGAWAPQLVVDVDAFRAGVIFLFYAVIGSPILFSIVYLLVRGVAGFGAERLFRNGLNAWVVGLLRGMAFGRDGDERLSSVAPIPHGRVVRAIVLDGAVAARMRENAKEAGASLLERYRWTLFNVGTGDGADDLAALARDALTWNSLIHTTYFDQPEVARAIVDFIAEPAPRTSQDHPNADGS